MKKNPLLLFVPLIVFALLISALVIVFAHGGLSKSRFASHVGEAVPATTLPIMGGDGAVFSTEDMRGRAYLVNFFASWCMPCHAEHEFLLNLKEQKIVIVGIAFKDKPIPIAAFLHANGGNPFFVIGSDSDGRTGIDWGVTGVPETFLIDAEGVIRFHHAGPLTDDVMQDGLLPVWNEIAKNEH